MAFLFKKLFTFLFLVLFAYFFYKIVIKGEKFLFFRSKKKDTTPIGKVENMEKDPVCGTYVLEKRAMKLKSEGKLYYFCSDKCRDEYIARLQKK